jgi:hypothetical protein
VFLLQYNTYQGELPEKSVALRNAVAVVECASFHEAMKASQTKYRKPSMYDLEYLEGEPEIGDDESFEDYEMFGAYPLLFPSLEGSEVETSEYNDSDTDSLRNLAPFITNPES